MELLEPLLELLGWLWDVSRKVPGRVRRLKRRLSRAPASPEAVTNLVELALANSSPRRPPPQRRGGIIRSGDLEVVVSDRLVISRERQLVQALRVGGGDKFAFFTEDGTVALFALIPGRPPLRLLDAADLTTAEWVLFAEMITEVTYGKVVVDPLPPFPAA